MSKKLTSKKGRSPYQKGVLTALLLGGLAAGIFAFMHFSHSPQVITWQKFEKEIYSTGNVDRIDIIGKEVAEIYLSGERDSSAAQVGKKATTFSDQPAYTFNIGTIDSFERKLEQARKNFPHISAPNVSFEEKTNWTEVFSWLMIAIIIGGVVRFAMSNGAGGTVFNFGKATGKLHKSDGQRIVKFDQVAGLGEAKTEVTEIVDFLKDPDRYTQLGATIPKGVLLVGPPGTGKTLLAKAVAGEAGVPFFSMSGSEFVEMYVGVGASRVRDLFKKAKEKSPCIVFIDEIDAVGKARGKSATQSGANDERESTLNQLLTEMDGFGSNSGVIVLAATNRADILDAALLRPGRFDRHIHMELPNLSERREIYGVHLRKLTLTNDVDLGFLAAQTPGFSGADIASICNGAALIAARHRREYVGRQDFLDAIDRNIAGLERKSRIISPQERRTIAYHEAGHAVVSWMLEFTDPLFKVSIIPRGKSLGAAWYLPEERQIRTQRHFTQRMMATLGGRAAEDIMFGEVSSGALDDLEKVTREAYNMVAYYGFNEKVGNISFYDSSGRSEGSGQKPYSEETGKLIDEEVRKLSESCYGEAKALLSRYRGELIAIAELLLKKEVIFKEDLEEILGKRGGAQAEVEMTVVNGD